MAVLASIIATAVSVVDFYQIIFTCGFLLCSHVHCVVLILMNLNCIKTHYLLRQSPLSKTTVRTRRSQNCLGKPDAYKARFQFTNKKTNRLETDANFPTGFSLLIYKATQIWTGSLQKYSQITANRSILAIN